MDLQTLTQSLKVFKKYEEAKITDGEEQLSSRYGRMKHPYFNSNMFLCFRLKIMTFTELEFLFIHPVQTRMYQHFYLW